MSSSDSDDDQNLANLREAVAPELICHMTSSAHANKGRAKETTTQVRSKCFSSNNNAAHHNVLKTTPEFRDHLSKKLSSYIDSIVEIDETLTEKFEHSNSTEGIKLLRDSKTLLNDEETVQPTRKRVVKNCVESDSDEDDKLSQVVVSGTDILMGGKGAFAYNEDSSIFRKRNLPLVNKPTKKSKNG